MAGAQSSRVLVSNRDYYKDQLIEYPKIMGNQIPAASNISPISLRIPLRMRPKSMQHASVNFLKQSAQFKLRHNYHV
jgi:hypothetical protein